MDEPSEGGGFFDSLKTVGTSKWLDPETYLDPGADVGRPAHTTWTGRDAGFLDSFAPGQDETLFEILALFSAAYGVRGRGEIMFASASHIAWWISGNKGLDAVTNTLASVQMAHGRYATAALPTIKATIDTTKRLSATGLSVGAFSWRDFMAQFIYVLGIVLVAMKIL